MHITLHLTNDCNLSCAYCYESHSKEYMSLETAVKAISLAAGNPKENQEKEPCGIIFFGGEPLLCRDRIREIVTFCRQKEKESPVRFFFKMTTNGTLLDEEFLKFSLREHILIALSHDGTQWAHDRFRRTGAGQGTYEQLDPAAKKLLQYHPYAPVMMTVCPETIEEYEKGIRSLWEKGFRYFICSLNYGGNWDRAAVRKLRRQYEKLAEFYLEMMRREEKFYFSPFEVKISSHIKGEKYCQERCELGRRQISVAPDGRIYPCTQFVGHKEYQIGDVDGGIDETARDRLYQESEAVKEECRGCALLPRCNCRCGCLNFQVMGTIKKTAPMLCCHERMVTPIADSIAETLYREKNGLFIQKHYNELYPLISLVEDRVKG